MWDVIVVGGGAAGIFAAINIKEQAPGKRVLVLEKSQHLLSKVKISGGGRCNVTHACFEPKELAKNYPRGQRELIGPFHSFQPGDVFDWFEQRGVPLKIEADNRVFPEANTSQAIINCFSQQCQQHQVTIEVKSGVQQIVAHSEGFELQGNNGKSWKTKQLIIATGSSKQIWSMLQEHGVDVIAPVPSLFTFNIKNPVINPLPGVSVPKAALSIPALKLNSEGPLLITHWGLSGPAVLKMSAWGARELAEVNYQFQLKVNWAPNYDRQELVEAMKTLRETSKKKVRNTVLVGLPTRLWESMTMSVFGNAERSWAEVGNKQIEQMASLISHQIVEVNGKSTFKEEFVTAGGVELKQIDFKTMQAKNLPGLYVIGEALNIDAITGGFNFQAAWTTAFIAAKHLAIN